MSASSLRILQVVASTDRRGAEVFAVELGVELRHRGLTVDTVALAPGAVGGLEIPTLGSRAWSVGVLRALRSRARVNDVVIAHGSTTLPVCAIGLAGTGVPFVYRNIGDPRHWAGTPLRRVRVRRALKRAAAVVAIAEIARDLLEGDYGVPIGRLTVIPNAVDPDRFAIPDPAARSDARRSLSVLDEQPVLAIVGALSPEKDVGAAIDAVGTMPEFQLVIVGDGPDRPELEARAARVAPGRVQFLGTRSDPRDVYAAADVVVMTSTTEGLPAVLIEAGLCGLPVVTTDVGFVREVVTDRVSGVVVTPGDPAALVAGIEAARVNRDAMGARAREICASKFALSAAAEAWEKVLVSVR